MYTKSLFQTRKLITMAILSAIGTVLMFIEIPSFVFWLKLDISDVVVYLGAIIYGPVGAIIVAFIKSLIHFFIKGSLVGVPIGQLTAFFGSLAYALPLYYITMYFKKRRAGHMTTKLAPLILSTLIMTLFMTVMNYLWITELYIKLMLVSYKVGPNVASITSEQVIQTILNDLGFTLPTWIENSSFLPKDIFFWFIVLTYVPFNLLKAGLLSGLFVILSYRLDFIIKRFNICEDDNCPLLQIIEE